MKQEEHGTVDQFVVGLSNEAANCEFGTTKKEQIRDQIIYKCEATELRRKLLGKGQELTFSVKQKSCSIAGVIADTGETDRRRCGSHG
jgi:membrane-bound inhibitor of C-type lysozyme